MPEIITKDVGCNPPPDEHKVVHVDMSKTGLFQRLGKVLKPAAPPPVAKPAPPRLPPAEELAELKSRLAHYESQYAAARAGVEAGDSAPITGGNINFQKQRLVGLLDAGQDVAAQPSVDSSFLASILNDCQGGGLIPVTRQRIFEIERLQATNAAEAGNAAGRKKAKVRLAKAAIELAAAFEAAQPFFSFPTGPCVRGLPTDLFRAFHSRMKNVKGIDDLL